MQDGNTDRVIGNLLEADRYYRIFTWINEEGAKIAINFVLDSWVQNFM